MTSDNERRKVLREARTAELERGIQKRMMDEARSRGGVAYKLTCSGRRGFPDLLILYQGSSTFVEVKTYRGRLAAVQEFTHNEIARFGGDVVTVYGLEQALEFLNTLMGKKA